MPLYIGNNIISGAKHGISLPEGIDATVVGNSISDCEKAIDVRDRPSLLSALGIPAETPPELIAGLAETLLRTKSAQPEARAEQIQKTGFWNWIQNASNAATVLGALSNLTPANVDKAVELLQLGLSG